MTNYIKIKLSDIKKYNRAEALILSLIRSFNAKNKNFEMKQDTIAKMLNVSTRKVTSAIKTLKDNNEITVINRYKKTSVYVCNDININSAYIQFDTDIFNSDIKPQDMLVLAFLENNYTVRDIKKYLAKSTVYDSIKRLKEKDLYIEVEAKEEKKAVTKADALEELNKLSDTDNSDDTSNTTSNVVSDFFTSNARTNSKKTSNNKFNNFKCREYSKEYWSSFAQDFFN